ncbi:MAG: 3-deoxy-manno-octulosonate cytidylyltransferase, partial [Proteobacteria bacterium]|nr:3-deoxy-manno-octulosonate cytidylyltransferase [Pseudomonadota bacterium]
LTWSELDALREHKKVSPFSGTTALLNSESQAIWFSKQIIPAIKKEKREEKFSPVFKHIGIYGYKFDALARYVKMPESEYEKIEELEQLRLLENGYKINIVKVSYNGRTPNAGIDSPEDLKIAEQIIASEGEFI